LRLYVAEAHTLIGDIHFQGGRLKEAMGSFLEAIGVFKKLVDEHPRMIWRTEAEPSVGLGQVYLAMGRNEDALTQYRKAAEVLERLLAQESESIVVRVRLLTTSLGIGTLELKHDVEAARKAAERAVAIADSLLTNNNGAPAFRAFAAEAYRCLGMVELLDRRPKQALAAARKGGEADPVDPKLRALLAHGYLFDGQIENARAIYREARSEKPKPKTVLQLFQKLVDSSPEPKEPDAEPSLAEVVLADFQLLRQIGLEHPEMATIEAELRGAATRPATRPGAGR
jgi:tetratricopeptide (TPR) repeat protein